MGQTGTDPESNGAALVRWIAVEADDRDLRGLSSADYAAAVKLAQVLDGGELRRRLDRGLALAASAIRLANYHEHGDRAWRAAWALAVQRLYP